MKFKLFFFVLRINIFCIFVVVGCYYLILKYICLFLYIFEIVYVFKVEYVWFCLVVVSCGYIFW